MKLKVIAQVYLPIYVSRDNEEVDCSITVNVIIADCDITPGMNFTLDKLNGPSPLYTQVQEIGIDNTRCVYYGKLNPKGWEELRQVYDELGLTLPGQFDLKFELPFNGLCEHTSICSSTNIIVGTVHDIVLHFYE